MRQRPNPGLRDLHVVLGRVEACTEPSDHLAIDHDWKASLHLGEAARRHGRNAAMVDRILERPARLLEQRCRPGFARCKFNTGDIGGMVHAFN
jgi:hypothetical protein